MIRHSSEYYFYWVSSLIKESKLLKFTQSESYDWKYVYCKKCIPSEMCCWKKEKVDILCIILTLKVIIHHFKKVKSNNQVFNLFISNNETIYGKNTPYGQQRFSRKKFVSKCFLGYSKTFFISDIFFAN